MNILITEMPSGITHTKDVPAEVSIADYINSVATDFVDDAVTEDCALDKPVSEYIITHDGPMKSRIFRDGDLTIVITAQ
ncbi:hypothetical protein D3C73_1084140 [compost metagenome]